MKTRFRETVARPSADRGAITLADVNEKVDAGAYAFTVQEWAGSVWVGYGDYQDSVRGWIYQALGWD